MDHQRTERRKRREGDALAHLLDELERLKPLIDGQALFLAVGRVVLGLRAAIGVRLVALALLLLLGLLLLLVLAGKGRMGVGGVGRVVPGRVGLLLLLDLLLLGLLLSLLGRLLVMARSG